MKCSFSTMKSKKIKNFVYYKSIILDLQKSIIFYTFLYTKVRNVIKNLFATLSQTSISAHKKLRRCPLINMQDYCAYSRSMNELKNANPR